MSPALSHLHGVHSNIDTAVQQRVVNLLGEKTLATDVGQGLVQHLVASGLHTPKGGSKLHETLVHPPAGAWSAIMHATAAHLDDVDLNSTVLAQLGEGLLRCRVWANSRRFSIPASNCELLLRSLLYGCSM